MLACGIRWACQCWRYTREELLLSIVGELVPPQIPFHERRRIADSVIGQCLHYRLAGDVLRMMVPADELAEFYQTDQLAKHIAEFSLAAVGAVPPIGRG